MAAIVTATYATKEELLEYMGFDECTDVLTSDRLIRALNRAQVEIEQRTNTKFFDGTVATPGYNQITNESHFGKGQTSVNYYLRKYPIPELTTTLDGAVTADDATITVVSTAGFPESGFFLVGNNKITYTGKTATTFTGCTGADDLDDGSTVTNVIIEISTTNEGQTPTWTVLDKDSDFNIEYDTSSVSLYNSSIDYNADTTTFSEHPAYQTPGRLRATYVWGWSYIPADITRCCLMIAARDLLHMAVRNAHIQGLNDFNPSMIDIDTDYINTTLDRYRSLKCQVI